MASEDSPDDALPVVPLQFVASPRDTAALDRLAAQARADLERINIPPPPWVLPAESATPDTPVLDVLVAGAGMCGQTAAYALRREGITNLRVIDRAARGEEGPWGTYARMLTLRSPKHVGGPELGVPSLSFRAWYEAQHGTGEEVSALGVPGWEALHKIGRVDWRDYLLWVRDTLGLSVENGVSLNSVSHSDDGRLLHIALEHADGRRETLLVVPHYSFEWQLQYRLKKPVLMEKGSQMIVTFHYDNSPNNPFNPDPTELIRWGDRSEDEMMVTWTETLDGSKR